MHSMLNYQKSTCGYTLSDNFAAKRTIYREKNINLKDRTYLTASNVKFLVKEPVIGLKIFDGEMLHKRLQVTFTSEAEFNYFSNKIQLWIGVSLSLEPHSYSESQKAKNLAINQSTGVSPSQENPIKSSQVASQAASQVASQGAYQNVAQGSFSETPMFSQPENRVSQSGLFVPELGSGFTQSERNLAGVEQSMNKNESGLQNAFRSLLNPSQRSAVGNTDSSFLSQSTDLFSNNTQYNTYSTTGTMSGSDFVTKTRMPEPTITRADLLESLKAAPFEISKKSTKSSHSKKHKSMDRLLEKTLNHIIKEKRENLITMSDEELAVKLARKLRSSSFLKLLKRVEHMMSE